MHSNPRAGTVPGNFTEYNFWVTLSSVVSFLFLEGKQSRCAFQAITLAVQQCQMCASEDFILGLST